MSTVLRPFRRPRLWLVLWLVLVIAVIVASLLPAGDLPPPPFQGVDKLEHLIGYAVLSAYAVMLFARTRHLRIALALIALGVALEFAQSTLTASRQADALDAVFNALGVVAGLALRATRLAWGLEWLDMRVARGLTR